MSKNKSSFVELSTASFSTLNSTKKSSHSSHSSINNSSILLTKNRIIKISNELLLSCQTNPEQESHIKNIPKYISSISQLNSNLFIYFYESILGTSLAGKKYPPKSIDDEIHNVKSIIDSLSTDILHEDLSHIQASAICNPKPDLLSLEYLLDIIRSIQEWISSRLDSISTTSKINSSSSLSRISPIKQNNSLKNKSKTERRNSKNLSKDRSTTLVSSLNTNNSSISTIKSPNKTKSNLSFNKKLPNFDSIRSSSTPRSAIRSVSKEKNEGTISKRTVSLSINESPTVINKTPKKSDIGQESIMSSILSEVSDTSPNILQQVLKKYSKQINLFEKVKKMNNADMKVERHLSEAYRRQKLLVEVIKKELIFNQRLEKLKRAKNEKQLEKAKKRESRIESAKVKKYIDNLRAKEKSDQLKHKLNEELEIKKIYTETFKANKETLIDLKKYNRDKSEERFVRQMNQIESMENYYRTRFELLNEQIKKERESSKQRENSQNRLVSQLKTQMRQKLDNEIKILQEQMCKENNTFLLDSNSHHPNRYGSNTFKITNLCN